MDEKKYVSLPELSKETGVPYSMLRKYLNVEFIIPGGEKAQGKKNLYNKQQALLQIDKWKQKA